MKRDLDQTDDRRSKEGNGRVPRKEKYLLYYVLASPLFGYFLALLIALPLSATSDDGRIGFHCTRGLFDARPGICGLNEFMLVVALGYVFVCFAFLGIPVIISFGLLYLLGRYLLEPFLDRIRGKEQ